MDMQRPLYRVGDVVRIKDLDTLIRELGSPIAAQCGWSLGMNEYAGNEYEVISVDSFKSRGFHYSYGLAGAGRFLYSEDVLEPACEISGDTINILMDYDALMRE